jgi:hypothetical protein
VQEFLGDHSWYSSNETKQQRIISRSYNYWTSTFHPDSFCIIVPGSLPSLDDLAEACFDSGHGCASGPFAGLHKAFTEFCKLYCAKDIDLPLVSEINTGSRNDLTLAKTHR